MDAQHKSLKACLWASITASDMRGDETLVYYLALYTILLDSLVELIPASIAVKCLISLIGFIPVSWYAGRRYVRSGLREECEHLGSRAMAFYTLSAEDMRTTHWIIAASALYWIPFWYVTGPWADLGVDQTWKVPISIGAVYASIFGYYLICLGIGRMSARRQEAEHQKHVEQRAANGCTSVKYRDPDEMATFRTG